jgi:hypothetical protein
MQLKTFYYAVFLFIVFIISGKSFAQSNFLPGYIIDNQLDTIQGLIDYRNWERNPETITFITAIDHPEQLYVVKDLKQFAVKNEIYLSAVVDKMDISNFHGLMEYNADIKLKKDTVFLQMLVRGEKDLLFLKDRDGIEQFYVQTDTSLTLLKYKEYKVEKDGGVSLAENKTYIGQLILTLSACNTIRTIVKDPEYKKTDLIKVFREYHDCIHQAVEYEKKKVRNGVKIGLLAGFSTTTVKINSSTHYLKDIPLESSTDFSAALSFDFRLSRSPSRWSLAEEILYTSYLTGGYYDDPQNPGAIELGFSYMKINNMLRYTLPVGSFSIFGNAGISLSSLVHEVNVKHEESIFHPPLDVRAFQDVKGTERGYLLGIGARYKLFSLHLRFEGTKGFSNQDDVDTPTKRWYVLGGYTF